MRFCDLCEKQVINVSDCCCLGNVVDLDIDVCSGQICALIVARPGHFCNFFAPCSEHKIPWCKVVRVGGDIILVDICLTEEKKKGR